MDQRFEQFQKDLQDQMQEQMTKFQQEMRDQMLEAQRNMLAQMTLMMNGMMDKGKGPMAITGEENEGNPLGFTPPHAPAQHEEYPQRPSVTIRPQQGQTNIRPPVNFQMGSGSNPGDNPANPVIFDLDIMEKEGIIAESSRQLEDRYRWLEEKFKALESVDHHHGIDAKDLSLVPDLILPHKFKMPEFKRYNGTSCPEVHITMFCRRMTGYVNNDQLLIHCFQDSLIGSAAKWYNQLSRAQIGSWKDLAQSFMKQYGHLTDVAPDRIMLQNMEKKSSESFRQYAQRWREVATQCHKSFSDIVMSREMIGNAVKSGKIDARESSKRSTPRNRENEVNNSSMHSKSVTVGQPKAVIAGHQGSSRRESDAKQLQFTPIPMTYKELYQNLFDAHEVAPHYPKPMQPPYPKWYDPNAQGEYHAGVTGHLIENCLAFKNWWKNLSAWVLWN
ncbi:hypothetical protein EPI10_020770 [Gossypium australe]|uniref:Retrotransposon gag domain-containing protein n=1 Tax=Gossypium australe TaxID=47621 RepID=A0A5B6WGX3_9ROSI|nr:hypothetical protein EPI10_020770 [Gossypium australe]